MTGSDNRTSDERKRNSGGTRLLVELYEALVAQNPNRVITLCDGAGKVVARHDPSRA